ncbi:hypothetical protein JXB41_08880 [Candidatus Woesearchaeota archaeon]|nr:hypothetical protein [Candidatus Woesearchaeota archaeon]
MTSLIACLSSGKGSWAHVSKLIKAEDWEKVFLITNEFGREKFTADEKTSFILISDRMHINDIVNGIKSQLENQIADTQVAVNFISGTGKEHMAVISALLQLGLALRFVYCDEEKCIEV